MPFASQFSAGTKDQARIQSRTVTAAGATTGTISPKAKIVIPTSDDANKVLLLPPTRAGHEILVLQDAGATGYELRAQGASIKINNVAVTNGAGAATKELAIAAAKTLKIICISATEWIVTKYATSGASAGGGTPNAV